MKVWLIILLVLTVSHGVQSQLRLVVNITCLDLAKPSNQQFRLICSQYDYHCLLDETFTKEFEVCREWKWIPGGKCAYFNTYGSGNVDERECKPRINLTCSESGHQFESTTNTQFTACYAKRGSSTSFTTTTSLTQITSNMTSDGDIATSSPASEAWIIFLLFIIGIAVILSNSVIFFIHKYMGKRLCKKGNPAEIQESKERARNNDIIEQQPFLMIDVEDTSENITEARRNADQVKSQELSKRLKNEDTVGQQLFLGRIEMDITSENPSTMKHENEDNLPGARLNGNTGKTHLRDKEKSAESTSRSGTDRVKQFKANEDEQRITNLSDCTVESLKMIEPPSGEQDEEQCIMLFNLLTKEGLKLTQEVLTAVFTRETKKPAKMLLKKLTNEEKDKLKEVMPVESHRILDSEEEREKSYHVSYGLHRIFQDGKYQPKSGWGNPVKETDIDIGDDVERLYSTYTIIESNIHNHVDVSIESYIRLLDIIKEALRRLDPGAEFEKKLKKLDYNIILKQAKDNEKAVTLM